MAAIDGSHLDSLAATVLGNLSDEHHWEHLGIHVRGDCGNGRLPRPLVSGLPPKRIYVHPDEQIEALRRERQSGLGFTHQPEYEWVLPVHVDEKCSISFFAAIFDSIGPPPRQTCPCHTSTGPQEVDATGSARAKRLLLATVHDDSTVVFYLMHDGIVKPRQN